MNVASTTILVLTPDSGDGIQTIKAGIMEIADIFAVNKCDLSGADRIATEIEIMLDMKSGKKSWRPPVIMTSTMKGKGVEDLLEAICNHQLFLQENGTYSLMQKEKAITETLDMISDYYNKMIRREIDSNERVRIIMEGVSGRELDPYTAATEIFRLYTKP